MIKFAKQPISITKAWKTGFSIYKKTFAKVWFLLLIGSIISVISFVTSSFLHRLDLHNHPFIHSQIFSITITVLLTLVSLYVFPLILYLIYQLVINIDVSFKNLCKIVLKKYGTLFLSLIYIVLIMLVVLLIFCVVVIGIVLLFFLIKKVLPVFTAELASRIFWSGMMIFVLSVLGTILIVGAAIVTTIPFILFENKSAWEAIKASWRLSKNNILRIIAVIFVPILVITIPFVAMSLMIVKLSCIVFLFVFYILWGIVNGFLVYPLQLSLVLVQFNDLKLRSIMKKLPS